MVARLEEFKELLIAEGVKYWRIFSIFPVGRAKDDPTLAVTDAQFREVLEFIKRTRKEGRIDLSSGCTSIRANFHQGNIYRDSFWDVWQNRFDKFRDREWARKGECADCKMWRFCLGGGMHLHDDQEHLMYCHYKRLQ